MKITFLGTGAAWRLPEHSCKCEICVTMNQQRELRTRTSINIESAEKILVDCGPDIRDQMFKCNLEKPDHILITHEHGDHFLGLDDLLAYKRSIPADEWKPILVYATEIAWKSIEVRFNYLLGSLIEKRLVTPGQVIEDIETKVLPFKTNHGPSAAGSVGYLFETVKDGKLSKVIYTSDFLELQAEEERLTGAEVLIIQSHWFNEPKINKPFHMSFQRAIDYIIKWNPKTAYLVHFSDGDQVPGDPFNDIMKKTAPKAALCHKDTREPYPVPRCHKEWQDVVNDVVRDYGITSKIIIPFDGMIIN